MKKIFILLLFLMTKAFSMLESYNSYQFIIGERSAGMARAYTSISDDPTAIWYNPAGLANIKNHRINISANSYSYLAKDQNKLW